MQSILFTDRRKIFDFKNVIKNLPKNSAIIIREYDLGKKDRKDFAKKILTLAKDRNDLKILVGKDFALAKEIKADGIHFSDFDKLPLQFFKKNSFPKKFIFSFACHSLKSLFNSIKIRADMIFISPIFLSSSHPDAKNLGLRNLAKITVQNKKQNYLFGNIYALGGIKKENLKMIKKLPLKGFGAIDYFLNL